MERKRAAYIVIRWVELRVSRFHLIDWGPYTRRKP
jgi:hypothetical protein